MSDTNILSHYINGQCAAEAVFNPVNEVCIDETKPITIPPLGSVDITSADEFVTMRGGGEKKTGGFGFLIGCGPNVINPEPPEFENSDIIRVSRRADGGEPDGRSINSALSEDGSVAAFQSYAKNLPGAAGNGYWNIFAYDKNLDKFENVSLSADGQFANKSCIRPQISASGRFVSFFTFADNLVPGDRNGKADVFVYDRLEKKIERVSVSSAGEEANGDSFSARFAGADGRYVIFNSNATNLAPPCTNGADHVFIRDRQTNTTTCVTVGKYGWPADGNSGSASVSENGMLAVFGSWAENLLAEKDDNGRFDIFMSDMASGAVKMLTGGADGNSSHPLISAYGGTVVFLSQASGFVPNTSGNLWRIFAYDLEKGAFKKCSGIAHGEYCQGEDCYGSYVSNAVPSISADGRFIAFGTYEKLAEDDTNDHFDVYVCDTETGDTARVSRAKDGGNEISDNNNVPAISGDGRYISFTADSYGVNTYKFFSDIFLAKNPLNPPF